MIEASPGFSTSPAMEVSVDVGAGAATPGFCISPATAVAVKAVDSKQMQRRLLRRFMVAPIDWKSLKKARVRDVERR
jgi:hypothetical protein